MFRSLRLAYTPHLGHLPLCRPFWLHCCGSSLSSSGFCNSFIVLLLPWRLHMLGLNEHWRGFPFYLEGGGVDVIGFPRGVVGSSPQPLRHDRRRQPCSSLPQYLHCRAVCHAIVEVALSPIAPQPPFSTPLSQEPCLISSDTSSQQASTSSDGGPIFSAMLSTPGVRYRLWASIRDSVEFNRARLPSAIASDINARALAPAKRILRKCTW